MTREVELDDKDEVILEELLTDNRLVNRLVGDYGADAVRSLMEKLGVDVPETLAAEAEEDLPEDED